MFFAVFYSDLNKVSEVLSYKEIRLTDQYKLLKHSWKCKTERELGAKIGGYFSIFNEQEQKEVKLLIDNIA